MGKTFDFQDLFILDLANNHQGSVEHATQVIQETAKVVNDHGVRAAIKFQFRELDSFIHPGAIANPVNKHINRFLSTRLTRLDFEKLFHEVRYQGLLTMCTPFDEASVEDILDMDFDCIKVASCSAKDWPLLEKIADAGKPIVISTGGLELSDIDKLHSFFDHRGADFAFMHCVSIYPTPLENMNLNQIDTLKKRFPKRLIGWSTHEEPNDTEPVQIAVAKGASLFERHIGIPFQGNPLNSYSSTPEQIDRWIASYKRAKTMCGSKERPASAQVEVDSILSLARGVFAKERIEAGRFIEPDMVYYAMPPEPEQLTSGEFRVGIITQKALEPNEALMKDNLRIPSNPDRLILQWGIHEAKAMLNEAQIALNSEFKVEYSHHYGIRNFRKTGAIIIDCFNRDYCKKLILQLPGQEHPLHFHKRKEETFQVLHGILHVEVDGHHKTLYPGETLLIMPGVWHQFWTETGAIFEEVSTTHYNDDSFYKDKIISKMPREERKTQVDHWGRFQLVSDQELDYNSPFHTAEEEEAPVVDETVVAAEETVPR